MGVQIKHLPTGIVVSNVAEKTQYANKQVALKQLETQLDGYDVILPLSRFKREMNKVFRKFEQDSWKLILITRSKEPLLVITKIYKS